MIRDKKGISIPISVFVYPLTDKVMRSSTDNSNGLSSSVPLCNARNFQLLNKKT